ncbi:MAG: hypothetical protein QXU54_02675 [Candidatus Micrarchaeia archaeon]
MTMIDRRPRLEILVIVDNAAAAKNAVAAYERHNVHVARTINEALNYLLKSRQKPDYIISDVFVRRNRVMPLVDNTESVLDFAKKYGIPLCFITNADPFGSAIQESRFGRVSIAPLTYENIEKSLRNIRESREKGAETGFENVSCTLTITRADGLTVGAWTLALDCIRNTVAKRENANRNLKFAHIMPQNGAATPKRTLTQA